VTSLGQRLRRVPAPMVDAGLAVALAVAITIEIRVAPGPGARPDVFAYACGLIIAALALARRRWPLAVLLASAATLQVYYLTRKSVGELAGGSTRRSAAEPGPCR
jgi:hypothetical protein